ncbi:helix-turn-helix domain-containing protein [Streptomyces sp. NPDC046985]|uniref:helix-turn-helix domain-containing protein n=1 Tax=Streptomyces sp. NPDC046985 TaxID=3155377 RepID=UPI0033F732E5
MPYAVDPAHDVLGLACWQGRPSLMTRAHRHDDIEINYAVECSLDYILGGRRMTVAPGEMVAFWAAIPHQLTGAAPASCVRWLTVPLDMFLGWRMPQRVLRALLQGQVLAASATARRETDIALFHQWAADLTSGDDELRRIAVLEMEARLRRLATAVPHAYSSGPARGGSASVEHAARMADFIARNFREPLSVERIAAVVPMHPHYAMAVFKKVMGATLTSYLNQCRIAEAQRLLITTDMPVSDITGASGFGSQSRFYASFTQACGAPPGEYRRTRRQLCRAQPEN